MRTRIAMVLLCSTTLGCWKVIEEEDVAPICIQQASEAEPLVLFVGGMATGPCERNGMYHCDIQKDGDVLMVQTTYSKEIAGGLCSGRDIAMVDGLSACAELDDIAAGTYTVEYGEQTRSVTVPNPEVSCGGFDTP